MHIYKKETDRTQVSMLVTFKLIYDQHLFIFLFVLFKIKAFKKVIISNSLFEQPVKSPILFLDIHLKRQDTWHVFFLF